MIGVAVPAAPAAGGGYFLHFRPPSQEDPSFLSFGAGWDGILNLDPNAAALRAEFRSHYRLWILKPFAGMQTTHRGSVYGFGGLLFDLYMGRRFVLTPSVAIGGYHRGEGKRLGSNAIFRVGGELAYRLPNEARLGLLFHHMSNAFLADPNPGIEQVMLVYSVPLDAWRPRTEPGGGSIARRGAAEPMTAAEVR